jgi:hypothetical protein
VDNPPDNKKVAESSKRAGKAKDPDPGYWDQGGMADDNDRLRSRVYFDDGSPEEYMKFREAAKADLLFATTNQEQKLASLLGNTAKGRAYAGRTTTYGSPTNLWAKLDSLFGGKTVDQAQNELDKLRQGSKDISTFIGEFADLAAQARLTDAQMVRQFGNQVNEGLQQYLLMMPEGTTFNEATSKARQMSPIANRQYQRLKGGASTHKNKPWHKEKVNMAVATEKEPFKGKCYNCDKMGHMANACRQPKRPRQQGKKATNDATEETAADEEEPEN